ncbi:hypothetical protein QAD02_007535 [Eretmocerus hayati]|uniref:Uncharacterized protein n=1 Tax=Eretmocerus hayati TaxID=131215 RepID=A0ACC2N3Z2_9HYME|nr:hypothetical protein QAD02_007535 [Eretmocerus hayati]
MQSWREKYEWVESIDHDPSLAYCTACNVEMAAYDSNLRDHGTSWKHGIMTGEKVPLDKLDFQKALNQIELTALWTFRGVSFLFADYLKITMDKIIFDSVIWSDINLYRRLIPLIARNVIAPCHRQRLGKILKGRKPALLADESTDFRKTKALALMTRYFDTHLKRIRDSLLDLIPLYDGDEYSKADHMTIALKIRGSIEEIGCTMEDFSFFGTDGAAVYRGANNSVVRVVQGWNGYTKDINCACHVQQLCTECAVGKLPYEVQKNPNKVANYFAHSEPRNKRLKILQIKMGIKKPLSIKSICPTRWLEYFQCMERNYELWSCLLAYFTIEVAEEKKKKKKKDNKPEKKSEAEDLLEYFSSLTMKVYHAFVITELVDLYGVQKELQSESPVISVNGSVVLDLYTRYLCKFMDLDHVMSVGPERVDPKDSQHWKKEGISLDTEVIRQLGLLSKEDRDTFLKVSRSFLVELCDRYREKFDFKKDFLIQIQALHPQNALSTTFHEQVKDLNKLDEELPAILRGDVDRLQIINNEWENLVIKDVPESCKDEKHIDVFWVKISELKDGTENFMFKTLADFSLDCLCVPNSNAPPERAFSTWHWQVTKIRTPLHFESVRGCLLSRQHVIDVGGLENFQVTNEMFKRMAENLHDPFKKEDPLPDDQTYMGVEIPDWVIQNSINEKNFCARIKEGVRSTVSAQPRQPSQEHLKTIDTSSFYENVTEESWILPDSAGHDQVSQERISSKIRVQIKYMKIPKR